MKAILPAAVQWPVVGEAARVVRWGRRCAAVATTVVVVLGLAQAPTRAEPKPAPFVPPKPRQVASVPVSAVKAAPVGRTPMPDGTKKPSPVWPAAGMATVDLPPADGARRAAPPARAGTLPVLVGRPAAGASGSAMPGETPDRVRVDLFDRAAAAKAGVSGVLLRVGRGDARPDAAAVDVTVDYRAFRTAFGGDWASRLRLTVLPDCALSEPGRRECAGTPLPSRNDPRAGTVSATVPIPATAARAGVTETDSGPRVGSVLVAVTSGPSSPAGSFTATSLQPSSTWTGGGSSGNFSWTYPMRVPPAPGGPAPSIALVYASQAVDGRHAASNNQPSQVGEGFEITAGGFIERRYEPCAEDMPKDAPGANNTEKTGDLCWATDNATLSLGSHSGELIYNSSERRWHLRGDDGSRIEKKKDAVNGDNDGEHWVVKTTEGTEYWFGLHRLPGWSANQAATQSTWTVPVFGNHANEPCHATAFADSDCVQAWRWNLDYIVDVHGNSASFWYQKETNYYALNKDSGDPVEYVRGGYLDHISYATRRENNTDSILSAAAPARVDFAAADRCLSGCSEHDERHWTDTPWDQKCTENQDDCLNYSPTFWSTKRLSTVTTRVRDGSSYDDVERWTLTHTFPDPGDGTRAGLWLSKLSHDGLAGGTASVPDIEFTGVQMPNRVDTIDFAAAMNWWRISQIRNEAGGTVSVLYSDQDCVARTRIPSAPASNTLRCYPVRWTPEGYANPVTDYFHKYVVKTVYEADNTGGVAPKGSPRKVTTYSYHGDPAWHYSDDDGLVERKDKTWNAWRGYARVGVIVGDSGEQQYTETVYFRGMHGDRAGTEPGSGTKTVRVSGTGVPTVNDEDAYAGMVRETTVFDGPDGQVVSRQIHEPWQSAPTASRTVNGDTVEARFTNSIAIHDRVALDGGRADRVRTVRNTFDSLGLTVAVDDTGDAAAPGDELCTKNTYEPRSTTAWVPTQVHRTQIFAVPCQSATNPATLTEDDVVSDTRTFFDGHGHGVAPTVGLVTRTEQAKAWNGGNPTFDQLSRAAYDTHGRIRASWDARDKETKSEYVPASGGLVRQTIATNPLGHETTTTVNPAWGIPTVVEDPNGKRTEAALDPLGRVTGVWKAGRNRQTDEANEKYSYLIRTDAPSVVSSSVLNPAGTYVDSYTLYDGLLRVRQTQAHSAVGGRLLTDVFYDTAGRKVREHGAYHAAGQPGTGLDTAIDRQDVPNQTRVVYDGAGRVTHSIFQPYTTERWRTSTHYGGDHTDVTPPAGGTATSTLTDVQGRTVAIRQFQAATPTGDHTATTYTYDQKGKLESVTDAVGNRWEYTYDLRGRQSTFTDPDKGTTTYGYDVAGRMTSALDARGVTLIYQYDDLNRRTAVLQSGVGARARWTYDTVAKGQLTQSVRLVGTTSYTRRINSYSDSYKPTSETVTIPASETGLGGTYTLETGYAPDGTPNLQTYPQTADLPLESVQTVFASTTGLPDRLTSTYNGTSTSYVSRTDYNALGKVSQYVLYTGLFSGLGKRVYWSFDHELETGRLTGIRTDREAVSPYTTADARYTFDDVGNIIKVADVANGDSQCFRYDHLQRLTEAWTPATEPCSIDPSTAGLGGPAPYWLSWEYDVTGNRKQQIQHAVLAGGNDRTTRYTYPAAGEGKPHALTSTTTTVGSSTTTASYSYNETGNLLTRPTGAGNQTLTWDPEGLLATSQDASGTTTYIYDADGNRLVRREPAGSTLYLQGQEVRYTKVTGATKATRYYTFSGTAVASRMAAGLSWLSADHQSTGIVAIDEKTQQALVRRQTPFGETRGLAVAWPNTRGFVGGTVDATGLVHLGARMYDPGLGRFISVDPLQDLNDPQQWNGYSYANNSPVTMSDPDGRKPLFAGNTPEEDARILSESGVKVVNQGGKWKVVEIGPGRAPSGSWMEYYWNNVRKPPQTQGKFSPTYGYGVTDKTLFGAAAVYDQDGNLVAADNNFRSGGGLLPGERGQSDQHLEVRVAKWYEKAGVLKPGYTLTITVNEEGRPACTNVCKPALTKLAERTGIRIIYMAPGAQPEPFGDTNSSATLKGKLVEPKAPLRATPKPLIEPPSGSGGTRSRGGGPGTGGAGRVGAGLGVLGFGADLYFFFKYGPCGVMPIEIPACAPAPILTA